MRAVLAAVLMIVGALIVIAGVLYFTQPAHALPTFLPGYLAHSTGKHTARGIGALVVGAVVVIVGAAVAFTGPLRSRW